MSLLASTVVLLVVANLMVVGMSKVMWRDVWP
jgi:hypothetical protein